MNFLDMVAMIAPRAASRYVLFRENYAYVRSRSSERRYEAAQHSRATKNWNAQAGSANSELVWDLITLRNRSRDIFRNNPYGVAYLRNLVAYMVGTGIKPRAQHPTKSVARKAQKAWDKFAKENKLYAKQRLLVRSMIEGGDAVALWREENGVPDSRVDILEGEFIDHSQTANLDNGGRRVMGVEYDASGKVVAYAMFKNHPGDVLAGFMSDGAPLTGLSGNVVRVPAEHIDHLFEVLRPGQTRGVPWIAPAALTLRQMEDTAEAIRMKKRIAACLAVFRMPGQDDDSAALGDKKKENGRTEEAIRPGMIITGRPGETLQTVTPPNDGDSDTFRRNEMMVASAAMGAPYHLVTGDVSQSNYTSIRADVVGFYMRLDDWEASTLEPEMCDPWFRRVMRREYMLTGDKRYLEVTALHTPPVRPWVDPYKDGLAKMLELRSGVTDFAEACAERGKDWREQVEQLKEINDAFDAAGLILDIDPRHINGAGAIQSQPLGKAKPGTETKAVDDAA